MITPVLATTVYLYPDADTFISSDNPYRNYGDEVVIWVGKSSNSGIEEARIRFSGIPVGATINNATLRLRRYTGIGAFTLAVQSASQSWLENSLTWHTDGSRSRWITPKSTYYVSDTTVYLSVDVTTHVQEWANGTRSNYGFHLTVNNLSEVAPGTQSLFYSREYSSTSDKPRLVIDYTINKADLKATWFYVKSWTVKEGDSFYIYTDVKNEGSYAAGASHARLYLSLDNDRDVSDDYEVTPKKYVPPLDVGEIANPRWDFQFPNLSDDPTYNVWLICVVDCDDEVPELNEDNIFQCAGGLTVTNLPQQRGSLQFKSSTYTVAEDAGSIRIYVSRTNGSYGPASVSYATFDGTAKAGSDYTARSGTLSWSDGDATDKYFDVSITNDSTPENDETFTANLSGASGASLGSPSTTTVTIVDEDPQLRGTVQFKSSTYSVMENGGSVRIYVSRTNGSYGPASVSYATFDGTAKAGSDYTARSGTLSWSDGDATDKYFD
ncbi:MAG: DNRLRE domain-containing protein, partial [Dehalococcoidia bacterium]|nr:DNRLRE domain-containing protein [Dehalococcoidia bacterium]